ncbi:MAG: hypothetical protein EPN97_18280 [Alphaproteobacteria bacterium]|nr:MAG: hypothetical protein EPN97_18280 [Alphaproteobacteria bacterium]
MIKMKKYLLVFIFIYATAMTVGSAIESDAQDAPQASTNPAAVYPVGVLVDGRNASQLTIDWWQWLMSIPGETNPARDLTGANCALGQQGSIWFLAGGFGSSKIHRVCTIPEGKILFFPLITMSYYPEKGNNALSCRQAKAEAALNNDTAIGLFAEIDGVAINKLEQYRVASSECFNIFERAPADQHPYDAYPSATDGFWLSVKPLKKGRHILKFGGRYNRNSPYLGRMIQNIEYDLTVQ